MRLFKSVLAFAVASLLLSCASGRPSRLDLGPAVDDPKQLESLCVHGTTGACALLGRETLATHSLPILQGLTSHQQSRFLVHVPKNTTIAYYVRGPNGIQRLTAERLPMKGSPYALDRFEVFHLELGPEYELIVIGPDGILWDLRKFAALNLSKKKAKIAIASCMDESFIDAQKSMWTDLLAQNPDAIFLIGDNVYADKPNKITSEEQLLKRYSEAREGIELFRSKRLVPILATWDDHDYGINDGDRTWILKEESQGAFFGFFPQGATGAEFQRGPGVASWWKAFGVNFTLLDNRSFRSPNGLNAPDQTHFGADQEKWLQDLLKSAREPVLMISGDQFFGQYQACESYETNHPRSLQTQIKAWRKSRVPVLFISGDRHLAAINEVPSNVLGFRTYELTSSAIHARVYKDGFERCPSPRLIAGVAGELNYMILEITRATRGALDVNVASYGPLRKLQFQKKLTVKR